MSKVSIKEIKEKVEALFIREGVDAETAKVVTEVIADTQMKGIVTHGFLRVPLYIACLRSGGVKPTGNIEVVSDTPTMALVSGKGGLGIAIAKNATEMAIKKAEECGVGIVNVRGSHHLGPTGYYANMCAERGMIGICMSNGNPMIAPTGGKSRAIGNNPFAYAVPAGKYGTVLYDIAMSMGSDMKIIATAKAGGTLPDGWIIDKNGIPTNDPNQYMAGGVLLPFGGHKGYGLAVMVELLAASMSGAGILSEASAWNKIPSEEGGNIGHFIMAIDVSKLYDVDEFIARNEKIIDQIIASPTADGVDKIYYPGEKEKLSKAACLESGMIDVADDTLAAIDALYNE